ncbi:MAG TPA: outer membrane beta-barrel protein [Vicinamibacterales bacterium]|nr:outer membrane beta-barrel protein [Vicinamibacterales bacterium]
MLSSDHVTLRRTVVTLLASATPVLRAAPARAQGFGAGGRIAWVTADDEAEVDAVRMFGGQVRLMSPRLGLEISMDRHTESSEPLNTKVVETPMQASLLMRFGGRSVSPYLLGGPGRYRRSMEALDDPDTREETAEFGWHAGIGLQILAGRRLGLHGDYRYTFLDFGGDDSDDEDEGFIGRFLPGHRGSMFTVGATIYF